MKPFTTHRGLVVPMDRANIDTDAILPKQFMKSISRTGYGDFLFDGLRYLDIGEPGMDVSRRPLNPDFILNQARYKGASILLAGRNFGCGSSREHAPWALEQFGFRVLIAPSFADIFYNNCFQNGILPIVLSEQVVDGLMRDAIAQEGYELEVDLPRQCVNLPQGDCLEFAIEPQLKEFLLKGLDEIRMTLELSPLIRAFEEKRKALRPWIFDGTAR